VNFHTDESADEGGRFIRKIGKQVPNHTALKHRTVSSSI